MSPAGENGASDLVVVGGGPRALYALADLDQELASLENSRAVSPLRVTVIEQGTPGAGAVWEPSQPGHLLMNVNARIVDATCPAVPLTFRQWQESDDDPFPPRSQVGHYLAWSFERLCESPRLHVSQRRARATSVRRETDSWVCETVNDAGEQTAAERAPRVLLATGHAGGAGVDHVAIADASRGPRPGAPVVLRGASLTAFDVVMDLTVGRGGQWAPDPVAASGLRYVPAGKEPSSITLVSRSGEPMLPKPVRVSPSVDHAVRKHTSTWVADSTPDDAWWEVLAQAAAAAATAAGTHVAFNDLWARLDGSGVGDPTGRWPRDVKRALGDVDGDPAWWWGRAWSAGYTDVVRSLERAPRDRKSWSRWRRRAITLERWAFGPPLATHRRLLALQEAGFLHVVRGTEQTNALPHVVVIDAFTRGPGVNDVARPWEDAAPAFAPGREPWTGLLARGHVQVRPGERGVFTAFDATCIDAHGGRSEGLAALGRPTEDPVVGHDSLKRRLH